MRRSTLMTVINICYSLRWVSIIAGNRRRSTDIDELLSWSPENITSMALGGAEIAKPDIARPDKAAPD